MSSFLSNAIIRHREVVDAILNEVEHRCLLVDVGCGEDEMLTKHFAQYFDRVVGVDPNQEVIDSLGAKNTSENVSYNVGKAEALPVEAGTVDLITAVASVSYFDFAMFMKEVGRVLKPDGCLAIIGSEYPVITCSASNHVMCDINACFNGSSFQPGTHRDYRDMYCDVFSHVCGYEKIWRELKLIDVGWDLTAVKDFAKTVASYGKHQPHERGVAYTDGEVDFLGKKCLEEFLANSREYGVSGDEFHAVINVYLIIAKNKPLGTQRTLG